MSAHLATDDLELYALGALDLDERRATEPHLASCADCRHALAEARGRVALLAFAAPAQAPPARVRQQLLDRIRAAAAPAHAPAPAVRLGSRWLNPALATAAVVLLFASVWLSNENRALRSRMAELESAARKEQTEAARARAVLDVLTGPDAVRVTLVAARARPLPVGRAFYHSRKGLVFTASFLPALPADKTYQLWLIPPEGNPISAGIFAPDARGDGGIVLPPLPPGTPAKAFAVTIEPAGGVPQPTGPMVLVGAVS